MKFRGHDTEKYRDTLPFSPVREAVVPLGKVVCQQKESSMTVKMEDGRGVIRLGDKTDHGGEVVQVAHNVTDMGKPIACKGDMVKCPKCKGTFPIAEGESTWTIDGVPVAFNGHKISCGAALISSW